MTDGDAELARCAQLANTRGNRVASRSEGLAHVALVESVAREGGERPLFVERADRQRPVEQSIRVLRVERIVEQIEIDFALPLIVRACGDRERAGDREAVLARDTEL